MKEELLDDFYWDCIKRYEANIQTFLSKELPVPTELSLLFSLAVARVIHHGAKFQVYEQKKEDTTKKKRIGFLTISTDSEDTEYLPSRIVFRDPEGNDHECFEDQLRRVMNNDYDRIILQKESSIIVPSSLEISIPDFKTEESENIVKGEEQANIEEIKEETPDEPLDAARLPFFEKDGRYQEDPAGKKLDDTFYFNQHDVTVNFNGQTGTIHFYVYPLAIKSNEKATDILVIAESGELCRVGISRGIGSSVELEFADIPFVVRGAFEQGEFKSQVNCLDAEVAATMVSELKPHPAEKRTSTTYVQLRYHGIDLNMFPAKFKNNGSTGYAPAAIAIERNSMIELLTPTSEGTFAIIGNDGEQISVEAYWVGIQNPEFRVNISQE